MGMRGLRAMLKAASGGIFAAVCCSACTVVYPTVEVGTVFRVKVTNHDGPVRGLRLKASGKRAVTDRDGIAVFRDMPVGFYFASVDHPAGGYVYVETRSGRSSDTTVALEWPEVEPVPARALRGVLHLPGFYPGQVQPRISIELLEGVSGKSIQSAQTNDSGEFNFGEIAPGLYFLRLSVSGIIGVAIQPGAASDHIDLDLGWTSCGMMYTDRNKCSSTDLQVEQLCGRVVDASGGSVEAAEVALLDATEKSNMIQQVKADRAGRFAAAEALTGSYRLVIQSPGFAPLYRTVHVIGSNNSVCGRPLNVRLGLLGGCSIATME